MAPPPVSQRAWEEAVGSRIARRTQPLRVERGILYVRVANAAWANELSLLSNDILAQLHARGLRVQALRFHVGRIDPYQADPRFEREVKRAAPADPPLPQEVNERMDAIDDDALRDAVADAAAKSLALGRR
jgi:hypothetical protein